MIEKEELEMMQQRWPEPASLHPKLTAGTEDVCNFM
jgi:hypothetical protein